MHLQKCLTFGVHIKDSADLIFFHPPYHDIIKYSGNMWGKANPDDLSRCENNNDFVQYQQ